MSCISFLWKRCLPRKNGKSYKNQKDSSFDDNSANDAFVQEICDIIAVLDQVNIEKDEERQPRGVGGRKTCWNFHTKGVKEVWFFEFPDLRHFPLFGILCWDHIYNII